jgi:hypothetical protein
MSHDTNLRNTLIDIAGGLSHESWLPSKIQQLADRNACTDGRNEWDDVTEEDFGQYFDYRVENHSSIVIIHPDSKAALQWCYKHLPADAPRWGKNGYVVEPRYVGDIIKGLAADNLISESEYAERMNYEQELQNAQQLQAELDAEHRAIIDEDYNQC